MVVGGPEEELGEGIVRKFRMDMYTLPYFKWIPNKDLLCRTWNSAYCYVSAWMGGDLGEEWIRVYEPFHCSPETITTSFINWLYSKRK